jgi:hypothetical protein
MNHSPPMPRASSTDILILSDGRILVSNLTPGMAAILAELDPDDELMKRRASAVSVPGRTRFTLQGELDTKPFAASHNPG